VNKVNKYDYNFRETGKDDNVNLAGYEGVNTHHLYSSKFAARSISYCGKRAIEQVKSEKSRKNSSEFETSHSLGL